MAQKVLIQYVDDLDGSEAVETVTFMLDGSTYEIDLNETHAAELRSALGTYIGAGRKTVARRGRRPSNGAAAAAAKSEPKKVNTSHGGRKRTASMDEVEAASTEPKKRGRKPKAVEVEAEAS